MRALVISHDPSERPGLVGRRLEQHGYRLDEFVVCDDVDRPESRRPFPVLDRYDAVVAMGAPWSVYDTATIGSWVGREIDLVREAHDRGIPYFGICFGAQLLAEALGGSVEPAPQPELGWTVVHPADPVVAAGPWFQWHRDRFIPPPDARLLAHNAAGPQAFAVERSLGVQFHPEVDRELLRSWLADELAGRAEPDPIFAQVGTDAMTLIAQCEEHAAQAAVNTRHLVDRFLHLR